MRTDARHLLSCAWSHASGDHVQPHVTGCAVADAGEFCEGREARILATTGLDSRFVSERLRKRIHTVERLRPWIYLFPPTIRVCAQAKSALIEFQERYVIRAVTETICSTSDMLRMLLVNNRGLIEHML